LTSPCYKINYNKRKARLNYLLFFNKSSVLYFFFNMQKPNRTPLIKLIKIATSPKYL